MSRVTTCFQFYKNISNTVANSYCSNKFDINLGMKWTAFAKYLMFIEIFLRIYYFAASFLIVLTPDFKLLAPLPTEPTLTQSYCILKIRQNFLILNHPKQSKICLANEYSSIFRAIEILIGLIPGLKWILNDFQFSFQNS